METIINLKYYNIWGQQIENGNVIISNTNKTLKSKSGKIFNLLYDPVFAYKIQKTQIKTMYSVDEFIKFLNEINHKDSALNSCTSIFINL